MNGHLMVLPLAKQDLILIYLYIHPVITFTNVKLTDSGNYSITVHNEVTALHYIL